MGRALGAFWRGFAAVTSVQNVPKGAQRAPWGCGGWRPPTTPTCRRDALRGTLGAQGRCAYLYIPAHTCMYLFSLPFAKVYTLFWQQQVVQKQGLRYDFLPGVYTCIYLARSHLQRYIHYFGNGKSCKNKGLGGLFCRVYIPVYTFWAFFGLLCVRVRVPSQQPPIGPYPCIYVYIYIYKRYR